MLSFITQGNKSKTNCTLLYLFTNQFLAPIPKGNLFVHLPPTYRCRNTRERVVYVFAWIPTILANNVFPSFPKSMWFELSLDKVFPIFFCRGNHVFVHFREIFPVLLWYTIALFVVLPNIVKVLTLAKQAMWKCLTPAPFSSSYVTLHLHFW